MMVEPMDDIARQARQGSVSAIIQILNDKLADAGIRTRAVFEQGILQVLCEAVKPEQLEQSVLVPQIRQILESIQPHRIRRVNINSRIVREQQLLWLEEINRDPQHQLLWSEEIVLRRPNFFQRMRTPKERKPIDPKASMPKGSSVRMNHEKRLFWRGLVGGASLSLFLLLVGWAVSNWLAKQPSFQQTTAASPNDPSGTSPVAPVNSSSNPAIDPTPSEANPVSPAAANAAVDPFTQAVTIAQSAVVAGQTASTSAQWLVLAAEWQKASDLMSAVPPEDARYAVAQSRIEVYRQNSKDALQQADNSP
jgi:hypothetical protein